MKFSYILSTCAIVMLLASCNKKKIDDLEKQINEAKSRQDKIDELVLHEGNSSIFATFTGNRREDSVAFNFSKTFAFSWDEGADETYMEYNSGDSTYDIGVYRYTDLPGREEFGFWIEDYKPGVTTLSNVEINVYADVHHFPSDTNAVFYLESRGSRNYSAWWNNYNTSLQNVTVNALSFNPNTRMLSIEFTLTDTESTEYNSTDNALTIKTRYSGKLYPSNGVYRAE